MLLGRFTEGRIEVLERLREELRKRGYVPIVFNFDKPETKDFTETVRLLAGMSKFVIADITNPKSAPLELQATVPEIMVPFQPIIEQGEEPFAMLGDLQRKHDWVFKTIRYSSLDRLIETMDDEIIEPAEVKFKQLLARRAEPIEDREDLSNRLEHASGPEDARLVTCDHRPTGTACRRDARASLGGAAAGAGSATYDRPPRAASAKRAGR